MRIQLDSQIECRAEDAKLAIATFRQKIDRAPNSAEKSLLAHQFEPKIWAAQYDLARAIKRTKSISWIVAPLCIASLIEINVLIETAFSRYNPEGWSGTLKYLLFLLSLIQTGYAYQALIENWRNRKLIKYQPLLTFDPIAYANTQLETRAYPKT